MASVKVDLIDVEGGIVGEYGGGRARERLISRY
jgi:hypothetical protein